MFSAYKDNAKQRRKNRKTEPFSVNIGLTVKCFRFSISLLNTIDWNEQKPSHAAVPLIRNDYTELHTYVD